MKRSVFLSCLLAVAILGFAISARAAGDYPKRAITAYIPLGAGDTSDIFIRTIAPHMEKFLGQSLVLVNKPGSGGATAISALQSAKPDGYTMSWANLPTLSIIPQMRKLIYDPSKLVYIATPMEFEYILFVSKDSKINSIKDLVEEARKNPDSVLYATPGLGSTNHLGMAWLAHKENVKMRAVPFEGNPKAISAVVGGHATAVNASTTAAVSSYKAGLLKPLAVMSGERINLVPDTQTLRELGYAFTQYSCLGAVFPAGTPEPVRQRMEDAIKYAVSLPEVQKHVAEVLFSKIQFRTGPEYKALIDEYRGVWGEVLDMVDLKMK